MYSVAPSTSIVSKYRSTRLLETRAGSWEAMLPIRADRRTGTVPMPATSSPRARTATVTPVTLARRLMRRHQLVTASGLCAMRSSSFSGCARLGVDDGRAVTPSRGLADLEHVAEAALGLDQRLLG